MKKNTKFIAATATLVVAFLLVLTGPSTATAISLTSDKQAYSQSDHFATFTATANSNNGDTKEFRFDLTGMQPCVFNADGSVVSGCSGLTITKVDANNTGYGYENEHNFGYGYENESMGYGYGYGDGNGQKIFQIKWDLSDSNGQFTATFSALNDNDANSVSAQSNSVIVTVSP